jgi:hypothetical protein
MGKPNEEPIHNDEGDTGKEKKLTVKEGEEFLKLVEALVKESRDDDGLRAYGTHID